jgi:hypothetical protein
MQFFLSAFLVLAFAVFGLPSQGLTTLFTYSAYLDGPSEFPPPANPSTGIGFALVLFDDTAHSLDVRVDFSGLLAPTSVAHIHAATVAPLTGAVGVAIPLLGFPAGVATGNYDHTFGTLDPSTYTTGFLTTFGGGTAAGAEDALFAALEGRKAYVNIHTTLYPAGEIRGFLTPAPATLLLFGTGLAGLAGIRLRRKNQ